MAKNDKGSAAVEFVLVAVPVMLVFHLLLGFNFAALMHATGVGLAARASEFCGLADVDESDITDFTKRWAPLWLQVEGVGCAANSQWAEVTLIASLRPPFSFLSTKANWHAAVENR